MASADVVTTRTEVDRYKHFDLEHLHSLGSKGVTDCWMVWCRLCRIYQPGSWPKDWEARRAADAHRHTVDVVAALARMRREIPPLLGDDEVA